MTDNQSVEIKTPDCPLCGRPSLLPIILPYFCANSLCDVVSWDPTKTLAEIRRERPEILDLEQKPLLGCPWSDEVMPKTTGLIVPKEGSVKRECTRCRRSVWLGPEGQKKEAQGIIICLVCAAELTASGQMNDPDIRGMSNKGHFYPGFPGGKP